MCKKLQKSKANAKNCYNFLFQIGKIVINTTISNLYVAVYTNYKIKERKYLAKFCELFDIAI